MSLAPWRSPLSRALHRNRSLAYSRYVQMATVRPNGRPANRTLVFRDFRDDSNQLQFITDTRSAKVEQIQLHPWGEVCWYFPKTREQFRIQGQLTLIQASESDSLSDDSILEKARRVLWHNLSDDVRSQFSWPSPAQPRSAPEAFDVTPADRRQPPSNFGLLLLDPFEVDHLELRGEPQNRWVYRLLEGGADWLVQSLNP